MSQTRHRPELCSHQLSFHPHLLCWSFARDVFHSSYCFGLFQGGVGREDSGFTTLGLNLIVSHQSTHIAVSRWHWRPQTGMGIWVGRVGSGPEHQT